MVNQWVNRLRQVCAFFRRIWASVCSKRHRLSLELDKQIKKQSLKAHFYRWCTQYAHHVKIRALLKPLLDLIRCQDLKLILTRWRLAISFDVRSPHTQSRTYGHYTHVVTLNVPQRLGDLTLRRRLLTKYMRRWRASTSAKIVLQRKASKLDLVSCGCDSVHLCNQRCVRACMCQHAGLCVCLV